MEQDNIIPLEVSKEVSAENVKNRLKTKTKERNKLEQLYTNEPDPTIKELRYKSLQAADQEIAELTQELNDLQAKAKKAAKKSLAQVIRDNKIAYIASDNKYTMVRNYSETETKVNLNVTNLTKEEIIPVLNHLSGEPGCFDDLNGIEIRQVFEQVKRSYLIRTSSFDSIKWKAAEVYNVILEQKDFWAPILKDLRAGYVYENLITEEYDPAFDDLIYSIAGGKQENIDFLEKWVAYKRIFPERCKITPGINITGIPGGNGKGMFSQLLSTIFTDKGVSLVKAKNFTGGFNHIMEGKVVAILDDEDKGKFPHSELKQTAGNQSWIIEPKGVDAYSVDATANIIVLDNTGLVRLVGGGISGEDRRWAVIITNVTLLEYLQQKYEITEDQSRILASQYAQEIFDNRIKAAAWLAHLIRKWQIFDMGVLAPLHGEDYQIRLAEQRDEWTEIFDLILPVMVNQGFIPFKFVKEIIESITGDKVKKPASLSKKFDEYLARKGYRNIEKADINYRVTFGTGFSAVPVKDKGAVRRLDPTAATFNYKLIANEPYDRKKPITKDTLEIRDFTTKIQENDDEDLLFTEN